MNDDVNIAQVIRNKRLPENEKVSTSYDYPRELLGAISSECHLGLVDVEQVLNAIVAVFEGNHLPDAGNMADHLPDAGKTINE